MGERRAAVSSQGSRPRLKAGVRLWRRRAKHACDLQLAAYGVRDFLWRRGSIKFVNTWTT
jgi:hypothetical protein